jgi:hypothetical protein
LPELLRKVGFDPLKYGIAFVAVDGIANLAKWYRLLTIYDVPVYIVFDSDSNLKGSDARSPRVARADIMVALGKSPGEAEPTYAGSFNVEQDFCVLEANFEDAAKVMFGVKWSELVTEAAPLVGSSKPLIARYAAKAISATELTKTATYSLSSLAQAIAEITPGAVFAATDISEEGNGSELDW